MTQPTGPKAALILRRPALGAGVTARAEYRRLRELHRGWPIGSELRTLRRQASAESRVGARLARLERIGCMVLHDRQLPGWSGVQLDHVVISPAGVWVVTTRPARRRTTRIDGGRLWDGTVPLDQVLARCAWEARQMGDALTARLPKDRWRIPIYPVLALHGPKSVAPAGTHIGGGSVLVRNAATVGPWITATPRAFGAVDCAYIASLVDELCPPST